MRRTIHDHCQGRFGLLETALAATLAAAALLVALYRPALAEVTPSESCEQAGPAGPERMACHGARREIAVIMPDVAATPAGRALLILGGPLALQQDWPAALKLYGAALEQESDNPRLHQMVGKLYDSLGRHREAQQIYLAALDHNPEHAGLFDSLDRSLMWSEAARDVVQTLQSMGERRQRVPWVPALIASEEVGHTSAPTDLVRNDLELADALDLINPLHHLPIVGTLYRRETRDRLDGVTKVIGGGLFGGPFGLFAAALEHAFEQSTGQEVGLAIVAAFLEAPTAPSGVIAALPNKRQPIR